VETIFSGMLKQWAKSSKKKKEGSMLKKTYMMLGIGMGLLTLPAVSFSQEQAVTGEKSVIFPQTYKCSTNAPCSQVTGEILRIEESYWIRTPDGGETHLKVTRDTKMEDLPKVGDSIAARLSSTGEADAIVKLDEIPKPMELPLPSHSQKELRWWPENLGVMIERNGAGSISPDLEDLDKVDEPLDGNEE
jgi:hypothetical protein